MLFLCRSLSPLFQPNLPLANVMEEFVARITVCVGFRLIPKLPCLTVLLSSLVLAVAVQHLSVVQMSTPFLGAAQHPLDTL